MDDLIKQVAPALVAVASAALTAFLAWAAVKIKEKFGIDIEAGKKAIEAGDRQALHWAMETAARLAVSRGLVGQEAIDFIFKYVFQSTPDAIRNLEAGNDVLKKIAESKLSKEVGVLQDVADGVGMSLEGIKGLIRSQGRLE